MSSYDEAHALFYLPFHLQTTDILFAPWKEIHDVQEKSSDPNKRIWPPAG